jgi:hypothetical protein
MTRALTAITILALTSCAVFRSPELWDTIQSICESSLLKTSEVQAKATQLGIPAAEVAAALCNVADVIEPFARQEMANKQSRQLEIAAVEQAISVAKSKGLL